MGQLNPHKPMEAVRSDYEYEIQHKCGYSSLKWDNNIWARDSFCNDLQQGGARALFETTKS